MKAIISEFQPGVKNISARDEINIENETSVNIKNKAQKEWQDGCQDVQKKHIQCFIIDSTAVLRFLDTLQND